MRLTPGAPTVDAVEARVGAVVDGRSGMAKPFKGVINLDIRDSTPDWSAFLADRAPEGAPNVLVVLFDDTGLAAWSPFGGRIQMPTLQRLADNGLAYSQWHTTALCSPTRSVFLTGRNLIDYEKQAFERGAMDFIEKSRGVETLVRRLKRVGTSPGSDQAGTGCTAQRRLTLHRRVSRALWDGVDLHLTVGEYNVVELLALNAGNYVSYRAIYDVLRNPGFVSGRGVEGYRANVRSALKRVRNKFRALAPDFDAIESYMAFGYRWYTGGD